MSNMMTSLLAQLACFDEEAFVALANRGLLRRAQKDLEKQSIQVLEDASEFLLIGISEQKIRFDSRGLSFAKCSCPAGGVCQHILAAALALKRLGEQTRLESPEDTLPVNDTVAFNLPDTNVAASDKPLIALNVALLAIPHSELVKHAGRAGYRWAWQFVQDLNLEEDMTLGGERHIVIGFRHPRVTLRYMGGGVESLIVDLESTHSARQRVAAVLAYRRAQGLESEPPEATAKEKSLALDLGKDFAIADSASDNQKTSRTRLHASVSTLLQDCVELGLSHLSFSIYERFSTLAVWAQGAEYYRLALLLRRIADHIESLLERAGGADEHRLFDEITLAFGLVHALSAAAKAGTAPKYLLGRSRSRYEELGKLDLLGMGSLAWRTPSGYIGLTMLFWSIQDKRFYACTDARPEMQRGFDPITRYKAPGPWSGLGAPALATGRQLHLTRALVNDQGRLSATETTAVIVKEVPRFSDHLVSFSNWSELTESRTKMRASLLAEPDPMRDWVVLNPSHWGSVQFDTNRQTLIWKLIDSAGMFLDIELVYSEYTASAILRIEQLSTLGIAPGNLLVARLRTTELGMVGEPISIIRSNPAAHENPVDALYFDPAPESSLMSRWVSKFRANSKRNESTMEVTHSSNRTRFDALLNFRFWLRRQSERGVTEDRRIAIQREVAVQTESIIACGFGPMLSPIGTDMPLSAWLIKANYVCMQFERLASNVPTEDIVG